MSDGPRPLATIIGCWAVFGAVLASTLVADATDSGRLVLAALTVLGVGAACAAAWAVQRERPRLAGLLLLVSIVTPTGFAYLPNVLALAGGVVLLARPARRVA